jgi:hypothetical protein
MPLTIEKKTHKLWGRIKCYFKNEVFSSFYFPLLFAYEDDFHPNYVSCLFKFFNLPCYNSYIDA